MARKITKTQAKRVAKAVSKAPKGVIAVAFLLAVILFAGYFLYTKFFAKRGGEDYLIYSAVEGEISFHFLTLGNKTSGSCVLVQAGENDILIDAGSEENSLDDITSYLSDKVTDGILEYVIVTHSDKDHIACFQMDGGIFDTYECEVIIDFPKSTHDASKGSLKNYLQKRQAEIDSGAEHYTALECYNNEGGAKRVYELSSFVTMEILYNYYYENNTSVNNNNSVCVMFNHEGRKFLFTGDLQAVGERKLADDNKLDKVHVYVAGHHGSGTSSSEYFLSKIRPDICIFQTVAGSDNSDNTETQMPAQTVCDEIKKYTDRCYVTSIGDPDFTSGKAVADMNGNIVVVSMEDRIKVVCSNNSTRLSKTDWYKARREATI